MNKRILIAITSNLAILSFIILVGWHGVRVPCPLYKTVHIHCPFCGCTRLLLALIDSNIYQAFRYNELMFICAIPLTILYIYELVIWIKTASTTVLLDRVITVFIVIAIIFAVMRNTPTFKFLAPTIVGDKIYV